MLNLGNVPSGTVLYIPFHTFDSNGASITLTGLAVTDIEIYKNGSATQRSSDNGYTLLDTDGIDFDSITGIHGFSIDLADNSDSGFFAVGSWYWVVVSSVTVDTRTVNFVAAVFRIVAAETSAGTPVATCAAATSALALLDDPRTEPGQGAPPVNPDLATKIDYIYKAWRNKITQTSTTLSLYADNASTVDHKATVSDDGSTFTRGEIASGP